MVVLYERNARSEKADLGKEISVEFPPTDALASLSPYFPSKTRVLSARGRHRKDSENICLRGVNSQGAIKTWLSPVLAFKLIASGFLARSLWRKSDTAHRLPAAAAGLFGVRRFFSSSLNDLLVRD